ncbi:MAG: hypothetical protein HFH23_09185 [Ruminococcus sp.]|nr:hypothetical protein [Ruminococcus sp.]
MREEGKRSKKKTGKKNKKIAGFMVVSGRKLGNVMIGWESKAGSKVVLAQCFSLQSDISDTRKRKEWKKLEKVKECRRKRKERRRKNGIQSINSAGHHGGGKGLAGFKGL